MGTLMLAAVTSSVVPYAVVLGAGFLIGVFGHINKSQPLIITGIVIIGVVSLYFVFVVAKIT